ncbi:hypothetical protein [Neolewinella antarctica]|uniref:Uncharacterized protein n=1 Tax=Neolewinella antarctica TaxID=442734 RepID=A0ABX0XG35_9BACT|nr:hypothetical protein [Neolewinella antarctica]NJC27839.1 hypothetical protein [Neolewinella antarctica]
MYRFFLLFLVMITTGLALKFSLPWYTPAIAAGLLAGALPVWRRAGFYFSFLGALLVWGVYVGYLHFDSEGRLSDRLAVTFGVGSGWMLVLITALWGGITAGLGGWFGASLRRTLMAVRERPGKV